MVICCQSFSDLFKFSGQTLGLFLYGDEFTRLRCKRCRAWWEEGALQWWVQGAIDLLL